MNECTSCGKEIVETLDETYYKMYEICEICHIHKYESDDESWAKGC